MKIISISEEVNPKLDHLSSTMHESSTIEPILIYAQRPAEQARGVLNDFQ